MFTLDSLERCWWAQSALMSMAQNPKEFVLLGGTFLLGLGELELALKFGGF